MCFIQHTTQLGESYFEGFGLSFFLLLSTLETSLVSGLSFCLESLGYFTGKNRDGCYR